MSSAVQPIQLAPPRPLLNPAQPPVMPTVSLVPTATAAFTAPGNPMSVGDWFTDPTQEIFSGVPNWWLAVAGAGLLLLVMLMHRRR